MLFIYSYLGLRPLACGALSCGAVVDVTFSAGLILRSCAPFNAAHSFRVLLFICRSNIFFLGIYFYMACCASFILRSKLPILIFGFESLISYAQKDFYLLQRPPIRCLRHHVGFASVASLHLLMEAHLHTALSQPAASLAT